MFAFLAVMTHFAPLSADEFESLAILDSALKTNGWNVLTRDDITPNRFGLPEDNSIEVRTAGSNALIYKPVSDDQRFPKRFRWRWRVDQPLPPTNILTNGGDDRPVSVYLGFEAPPNARRGFFKRVRNALAEVVVGVPIFGYSLTYTWGGTSPIGTMFNNPHLRDESFVFVRQNSESSLMEWQFEEVDVTADFVAAFGIQPTPLRFIAIAADSEDTGVASLALVADLELVN